MSGEAEAPPRTSAPGLDAGMSGVLRRNIQALAELRRKTDAQRDAQTRVADAIAQFAGSIWSLLLHAVLVAAWLAINVGMVPWVEPFDPFPFVMLAMIASVEAIFLSTFVLISQNRMARLSSRRDELDVQISLLAEHEVTRLIQMMNALMRHHGVALPADEEIRELETTVNPNVVFREIERAEEQAQQDPNGS